MKARLLFIIAFLLFVNIISYSQSISETEIYSSTGREPLDPWNIAVDYNTGKIAYIKYDVLYNMYSVIYEGKESGKYGFISNYDIKFDSKGNYYVLATEYTNPDSYSYEYVLLVNGDSIGSFPYAEPYNAMMMKNDEFKFSVRTGDDENAKTKLITYSMAGGLKESEEYLFVKPIYKGSYTSDEDMGDAPSNNYYIDGSGNTGYVISDGINASIMFGDNITRTEYTDIDASSFVNDNNGQMCYIAKNGGLFYSSPGNEFLVQGSQNHAAFDNVYSPILFTSANVPVYTGAEYLADMINNYFVIIGDEKQNVYLNSSKTTQAERFTGGLYDLKLDDKDNISYYGTIYSEVMENKEGPNSKSAYVMNGVVVGKFYEGLGMWKFNGNEGLVSYSPNNDYYTSALLHKTGNDEKVIFNKDKYTVQDYGFNNDGDIYYVIMQEGNYDTKVKPEYSVYIDGLLAGKYEMMLFEGIGLNTSMVQFDSKDNYAFAVSTFNYYEEGKDNVENHAYVITNKGKQDPEILSGNSAEDYDYIENMFYTTNDKLFYIGGINNYSSNVFYSEIIVDGVNLGKAYTGISNVKYNKSANTVTFLGSRAGAIYKVTINF